MLCVDLLPKAIINKSNTIVRAIRANAITIGKGLVAIEHSWQHPLEWLIY